MENFSRCTAGISFKSSSFQENLIQIEGGMVWYGDVIIVACKDMLSKEYQVAYAKLTVSCDFICVKPT